MLKLRGGDVADLSRIIDADFKVVTGRTADAVELESQTVKPQPSAGKGVKLTRMPALTAMAIHQIWEDRRTIAALDAKRAKTAHARRWAIAFAMAILFYGLSGVLDFHRIPWR
jgi:hypothetical protein